MTLVHPSTQNILRHTMAIVLPELPWAKDALAPHISAEVSCTAESAEAAEAAAAAAAAAFLENRATG